MLHKRLPDGFYTCFAAGPFNVNLGGNVMKTLVKGEAYKPGLNANTLILKDSETGIVLPQLLQSDAIVFAGANTILQVYQFIKWYPDRYVVFKVTLAQLSLLLG